MRYLRLIGSFVRASFQQELAYRANFAIGLLHSLLNLATGVLALVVLFGQVQAVRGWTFASTLALLGVYLLLSALRGLFIGPSLNTLAGLDGDVMSGRLDFTLLRPVDLQLLVSLRQWRLFALVDLVLALGVLAAAMAQLGQSLSAVQLVAFLLALFAGVGALYAILLAFSALAFFSPGILFTWVLDGMLQMARYPVGMYPGWLRLVLTWVIPVGVMTTIPAQALSGEIDPGTLAGAVALSLALMLLASYLFRRGIRRYNSASS
jgi:ABC-2 type transport system permease protein